MVSEALPKCRLNRPVRVTGWPPPIRAKAPSSIPLSSTAVLRAVEELGYKPNRAARSLVSQRTFTVGAVVSDLRNTWYIDLLEWHCHVGECRRPGRIGGVRTATASYKGHRYPVEIINHCVWLYFRFSLSFREGTVTLVSVGALEGSVG